MQIRAFACGTTGYKKYVLVFIWYQILLSRAISSCDASKYIPFKIFCDFFITSNVFIIINLYGSEIIANQIIE